MLNGSFHGFPFTLLKWKATMRAIMEIGSQEADERLVLVVSDADLQRWDTRSAFGVQYLTWTCSCRCFSIVMWVSLKMLCTPLYPMVNDHYPY